MMQQQGNSSEIALLRARIDLEVQALQQIKSGFAKSADHETIMNHYRMMGVCCDDLAKHVGEEKAVGFMCERVEKLL